MSRRLVQFLSVPCILYFLRPQLWWNHRGPSLGNQTAISASFLLRPCQSKGLSSLQFLLSDVLTGTESQSQAQWPLCKIARSEMGLSP